MSSQVAGNVPMRNTTMATSRALNMGTSGFDGQAGDSLAAAASRGAAIGTAIGTAAPCVGSCPCTPGTATGPSVGALVAAIALAACVLTSASPTRRGGHARQGVRPADAAMRAADPRRPPRRWRPRRPRGAEVLHDETFGNWTMQTVVPIASASKWLTAATLMTFVDHGRMRLDDPVSNYLPGFDGAKQAITVRMLLSHTHGLVSPGCEGNPTTNLAECAREVADGPHPPGGPGRSSTTAAPDSWSPARSSNG